MKGGFYDRRGRAKWVDMVSRDFGYPREQVASSRASAGASSGASYFENAGVIAETAIAQIAKRPTYVARPGLSSKPPLIHSGVCSPLNVGEESAAFGFGEAAPYAVGLVHTQREVETLLLHEALLADAFGSRLTQLALVASFRN
jgi:hypothetical protein